MSITTIKPSEDVSANIPSTLRSSYRVSYGPPGAPMVDTSHGGGCPPGPAGTLHLSDLIRTAEFLYIPHLCCFQRRWGSSCPTPSMSPRRCCRVCVCVCERMEADIIKALMANEAWQLLLLQRWRTAGLIVVRLRLPSLTIWPLKPHYWERTQRPNQAATGGASLSFLLRFLSSHLKSGRNQFYFKTIFKTLHEYRQRFPRHA